MSWNKSVFSSNVVSVGWDSETSDLLVEWKSGKRSAYAGVTEETALALSTAPSVGQMLNMEIKPNYPHRYV